METIHKEVIQLGSKSRSGSRLRSPNAKSVLRDSVDKPFRQIQNNMESRVVMVNFTRNQSNQKKVVKPILNITNSQSVSKMTTCRTSRVNLNENRFSETRNFQHTHRVNEKHLESRLMSRNRSPSGLELYSRFPNSQEQNSHNKMVSTNNSRVTKPPISLQSPNSQSLQLSIKLRTLQHHLHSLTAQKHSIQSALTTQNLHLLHQNRVLLQKNSQLPVLKQRIAQMENMLEKQIQKSLELMDFNEQIQREKQVLRVNLAQMRKQNEDLKAQILVSNVLKKELQAKVIEERQKYEGLSQEVNIRQDEWRSQIQNIEAQMQLQIQNQAQQIVKLNQNIILYKEQSLSFKDLVKQQDSIIENFKKQNEERIANIMLQKNHEISLLNQTIYAHEIKLQSLQKQLQSSFSKTFPLGGFSIPSQMIKVSPQKQQCKKCQQLLKTVFRLNSYLNKK